MRGSASGIGGISLGYFTAFSRQKSQSPEVTQGWEFFADNTSVLANVPTYEQTVIMLQENLDDVQEWIDADGTNLNASKSENVVFTLDEICPYSTSFEWKSHPPFRSGALSWSFHEL